MDEIDVTTNSIDRMISIEENSTDNIHDLSVYDGLSPSIDHILEEFTKLNILFSRVRFTIMFLLSQNWSILSSDLRSLVDVTWGSYISNINALEQEGYIEYETEFVDTNPKKVVRISRKGELMWNSFVSLINQMTL